MPVATPQVKKPLLVLCHHPEDKAGPLLVTLRTVLTGGRAISSLGRDDFSYQDMTASGAFYKIKQWLGRHPDGWILFTGALSLRTMAGMRTLLHVARSRQHRQIVFWHDTSVILRYLAGREFGLLPGRLFRRIQFLLIRKLLYNTRTYHLAVSKQCKQLVMFLVGVTPDRIHVCGEAVEVANCPSADRTSDRAEKRFCMAGVLTWRKGTDRFVGIASRLHELYGETAQFTWFGGSEKEIDAFKRSNSGPLADDLRIQFPGYVSPLSQALAGQDVFLMTSRDDPFPIVALEALACDLPVFCYDTTGTAEIVPREFVCHNGAEMAEKVRQYFERRDQYPPGFFAAIARNHGPEGQFLDAWNRLMGG